MPVYDKIIERLTSHVHAHSLAYAEGRLILGRAVWKFDFRLSESAMGWMDNQKGYVTWLRPEMETYIRLR